MRAAIVEREWFKIAHKEWLEEHGRNWAWPTAAAKAAKIMMVALKNIAQPALVFVALRFLAYRNPVVSQAVLTTAIPAMPILIMFATQFCVARAESAAAVFLSSVSSVITMGGLIALTSQLS